MMLVLGWCWIRRFLIIDTVNNMQNKMASSNDHLTDTFVSHGVNTITKRERESDREKDKLL